VRSSNATRKLADLFSIGTAIEITSAAGTNMKASLGKILGSAETGLARYAGEFSTLPAGKASVVLNGGITGQVVLERIAGMRKRLNPPVKLSIKNSQITQIKGQDSADLVRRELRRYGKAGRQIRELAVGANPDLMLGMSTQEDERALGVLQLRFGSNQTSAAKNRRAPEPLKGLVLKPTIRIDGRIVVEEGRIIV